MSRYVTVKERWRQEVAMKRQEARQALDEWERRIKDYYACRDSKLHRQQERLRELSLNAISRRRDLEHDREYRLAAFEDWEYTVSVHRERELLYHMQCDHETP